MARSRPAVRLLAQPDGITCGPTCLSMVHDAFLRMHGSSTGLDVMQVAAMTGTNATTGTTHEGVAVAVGGLGLKTGRTLSREPAMAVLDMALADGAPVLCRTLTHGVKHWVLATGRRGGVYDVADPWLGTISLARAEMEARLAPRGYEVWPMDPDRRPRDLRVGPLLPPAGGREGDEAVERALDLAEEAFGSHMSGVRDYVPKVVDWSVSRALRVDGRIMGVYLLSEGGPARHVPAEVSDAFEGHRGVEGVALVVSPHMAGQGLGRLLREEPARLGYDFVWGMALRSLGNLDHWLARRELIHADEECWYTAQSFTPRLSIDPAQAGLSP